MADVATTGYTVDDLDWLREEIGVAHLELDPWGSLILSGTVVTSAGAIEFDVDGGPVRLELP